MKRGDCWEGGWLKNQIFASATYGESALYDGDAQVYESSGGGCGGVDVVSEHEGKIDWQRWNPVPPSGAKATVLPHGVVRGMKVVTEQVQAALKTSSAIQS